MQHLSGVFSKLRIVVVVFGWRRRKGGEQIASYDADGEVAVTVALVAGFLGVTSLQELLHGVFARDDEGEQAYGRIGLRCAQQRGG